MHLCSGIEGACILCSFACLWGSLALEFDLHSWSVRNQYRKSMYLSLGLFWLASKTPP